MLNQHIDIDFKLNKEELKMKYKLNGSSKASDSLEKAHLLSSSASDFFRFPNNLSNGTSTSSNLSITSHVCKDCQRSFKDVNNYKEHRFQEHQAKEFSNIRKCSMCSYATLLKSKYDCHMRCHLNNKVIKCNRCDYSTINIRHMSRHERMHMISSSSSSSTSAGNQNINNNNLNNRLKLAATATATGNTSSNPGSTDQEDIKRKYLKLNSKFDMCKLKPIKKRKYEESNFSDGECEEEKSQSLSETSRESSTFSSSSSNLMTPPPSTSTSVAASPTSSKSSVSPVPASQFSTSYHHESPNAHFYPSASSVQSPISIEQHKQSPPQISSEHLANLNHHIYTQSPFIYSLLCSNQAGTAAGNMSLLANYAEQLNDPSSTYHAHNGQNCKVDDCTPGSYCKHVTELTELKRKFLRILCTLMPQLGNLLNSMDSVSWNENNHSQVDFLLNCLISCFEQSNGRL